MRKKIRVDLTFRSFIGDRIQLEVDNINHSDSFKYITAKDISSVELNKVVNLMDKEKNVFTYRIVANGEHHNVLQEDFMKAKEFFEEVLKQEPPITESYRFLSENDFIILRCHEKFTLVKQYNLASPHSLGGITYSIERYNPAGEYKSYEIAEDVYNKLNDSF